MVEKAFAVGAGGIVGQNVRLALVGLARRGLRRRRRPRRPPDHQALAATRCSTTSLARLGSAACTFLDLDRELVERELRARGERRSGPHAENMLRDIGTVAAGRSRS